MVTKKRVLIICNVMSLYFECPCKNSVIISMNEHVINISLPIQSDNYDHRNMMNQIINYEFHTFQQH